jgi:hypothetical protein
MHKGQLGEMGSHQGLLAARGLHWKLYQLQDKNQELGTFIPPPQEASEARATG